MHLYYRTKGYFSSYLYYLYTQNLSTYQVVFHTRLTSQSLVLVGRLELTLVEGPREGPLSELYTGSKRYGNTSDGRDKYNSLLTSADEYVEEDSFESLLLIDELCKLPVSAIATCVIKLLRYPIICHRFNYS